MIGQCRSVGARRGQRVVDVSDRDDACARIDRWTGQTPRVSAPVPRLVMLPGNPRCSLDYRDPAAGKKPGPEFRMPLDVLSLLRRKRAALHQHPTLEGEFSQVVEGSEHAHLLGGGGLPASSTRNRFGDAPDPVAVPGLTGLACLGRAGDDRCQERFKEGAVVELVRGLDPSQLNRSQGVADDSLVARARRSGLRRGISVHLNGLREWVRVPMLVPPPTADGCRACPPRPNAYRPGAWNSVIERSPIPLLDEQLRFAIVAACQALAATPGAVYPLVYLGPLRGPQMLTEAALEAGKAFGIAVTDWQGKGTEVRAPGLLICSVADAAEAVTAVRAGVQLIAWGDVAVHDLPEAVRVPFLMPSSLAIDPEVQIRAAGQRSYLGDDLDAILAGLTEALDPIVILCDVEAGRLYADQAILHLECGGRSPVEVTPAAPDFPRGGAAVVLLPRPRGGPASLDAARWLAGARMARCLVVVVTQADVWSVLQRDEGFAAEAARCTVMNRTSSAPDALASRLSWPRVPTIWLGAPRTASGPVEAISLPRSTSLLEALRHIEVRGRASRLVAWTGGRAAVVDVDARAAGVVVIRAEVLGSGAAHDRDALLIMLDAIRQWDEPHIAILSATWSGPVGEMSEPVQRIGFYFSRRDDERGEAPPEFVAGPEPGFRRVAYALVEMGLESAALALLQRAERESRWGVEEEMLLSYLVAEIEPDEAVTRLRHAAVRLASAGSDNEDGWKLQTHATLNAVLLMVRRQQVGALDAWESISEWVEQGSGWLGSARHAAVLFELAARAGQIQECRRFAEMFRSIAADSDPLRRALAPAFLAVLEGDA